MRNLKRTLSLALAAVMLMGMMVVGAGAASKDFTDASEIKNVEAVDVMVALGILEGGDKGDFQPNTILTREQAAKIICYMLMGSENAEKLATSGVVFSDVAADRWSAPYIAYCVNMGILAGDGNGHFFPEGKLTGAAFAKMLLVALGYDAGIEKYVGDTWTINVATGALDAGILPDGLVLTNELSRQDAAQMAFQTLTASMVKYASKGTTVVVNGAEIITGNTAAETLTWKGTEGKDYTTGNASAAGESVQFCEKYFKDLKQTNDSTDDFGRPAQGWMYKSEKIGVYGTKTPVLTYTTEVKGGDLYKDLGKPSTVNVQVYVDGSKWVTSNPTTAANIVANNNQNAVEDTSGNFYTGNGTVTEVYETAANTYSIVVVNQYLAKVSSVTKADADKDVKRTLNLSVSAGVGAKTYESENFEKGDYVLVTVANGTVKSAVAAEKVENVVVTSYKSDSVTAGGTTYKYSMKPDAITDKGNYNMASGNAYTFYLDTYGNIIKGETYTASNDNYVFVAAVSSSGIGDPTIETVYKNVKYISMDGTSSVGMVAASKAPTANTWCTVEEDSDNDGYLTFTAVGSDAKTGALTSNKLDKTQPTIATGIVANADTTFVLQTGTSEYKAYEGIANLPGYTGSGTAYAVVKDGYAVTVFVDVTSLTTATTGADDLAYLLDTTADGTEYDATNKVTLKVYDAVVNGELTTIKVASGNVAGAGLVAGLVKITAYDGNGYVKTVAAVSGAGYASQTGLSGKTVSYSEPTLTVDGTAYLVAADTAVYMINADNELTVGTAADLEGTVSGDVYVVYKSTTDKTVTAIYFDGTIA